MEVIKEQKMTGKQMQPATSDKTFHLKWNNHLQNLSQLFTAIYSSSALADVTLSCRDGAIRAHKLVLSACSPYFEQIFRDNPCKHPVVILKGIPYAEINLLVEFMYKGSVDVQEIDLQSLMHTASELEVRGLAYELRKDASSLLNVNLNEYPTFNSNQTSDAAFAATAAESTATANASYESAPCTPNAFQSNLERLHQIHLYQQSMCRSTPYSQTQSASNLASEIKRKRKNEDPMTANTTTAVKNILAAAAKELAEKKNVTVKTKTSTCIQTEDEGLDLKTENYESDSGETEAAPESEEPAHGRDTRFKGKKRVSVGMSEDFPTTPRILAKSKQGRKNSIKLSIKAPHSSNSLPADESEDGISNVIISAVTGASDVQMPPQGILKCVNLNDLREAPEDNNVTVIDDDDSSAVDTSDENNLLVEASYESPQGQEEEYDSSDSKNGGQKPDDRIFKCDICSLSFVRKFHMKRHRRTHTGERPFQCDDCPFSFNRSSHLARHRRTHTGERPYRCEACGRTFTRGDKLKLHLRICEKDEYVLPSRLNTEDPSKQIKKDLTQTMLPGMVSIGHNERHQLMFTASGDVVLAPRSQSESMGDVTNTTALSELSESNQSALTLSDLNTSKLNLSIMSTQPSTSDSLLSNQYFSLDASGYPIKRGRGRPRKKPLPVVVPLIKKKRGRPPKIIKLDPMDTSNRPMENYNVSNLPYGDFSYLTDILSTHFNQSNPQAYQNMIQLNPMLENAKFANIISNAVAQSTMSASITNAMNTPEPCKTVTVITKDDTTIPPGITVIPQTSNKDDSQPTTTTENATEKIQEPSIENTSAIVENQNSTLIENDCAITDLTSDKEDAAEEDLGENVSNENNALNDKIEQSMRIGDCQVSKVVSHPKLDVNAFASSLNQISTLGECTIKPVAKND